MTGQRHWGVAGVQLTPQEVAQRRHAAAARRNKDKAAQRRSDEVAYRRWLHGEVRPCWITYALNAKGLYGPEVDTACGAAEPDVDLWEAGKLYPTWEQLQRLADLTGVTPAFLTLPEDPIPYDETTLRFHLPPPVEGERGVVLYFEPEAWRHVVAGAPERLPRGAA